MDRREFLKLAASAGVGVTASQFPFRRLAQTRPYRPRLSSYEEAFKTVSCGLCPAGCSMKVRLVNGHAVGVSGNPLDPLTGGGLCPKGLSSLHLLYHPDRLKKPLRRTGPRGSNQWAVVEWEEALESVASKLSGLLAKDPESLVFLDGRPESMMHLLIERWMSFLGSPNHIPDRNLSAFPLASQLMMGRRFEPSYSLAELDMVVSVGDPFLDYCASPVYLGREYAAFRRGPNGERGYLVLFDDTHGVTAQKADEFHRIEPATHGLVLLALANIIVRNGWYDRELIARRTTGFETWRDQVLSRHSPESVQSRTGIPAEVLYAVASRLAQSRRRVVYAGAPVMSGPGGLHNAMAVLALNMLLGSIDRDLHLEAPFEELVHLPDLWDRRGGKPLRLDTQAFPVSEAAPWAIPEIIAASPDSVSALFLYYSNPVATHPDGARWLKALAGLDLVVSFSPFMDETSRHADWILPESLFLERYHDFIHPPISGMARVSVSQPLWDEPLYDTRPAGDVLLQLATKLRPTQAEDSFPWNDYSEFMEEGLEQIWSLKTGTLFLEPREFESFRQLAARGYWSSPAEDEDTFFEQLYQRGGWVQPVYVEKQWGRLLQTPSGRFEFASSELKRRVETFVEKSLEDLGLAQLDGTYTMPNFLPAAPGPGPRGKLTWLVTWNTSNLSELPWWWEVVGMHRYIQWAMWAELGTDDAEAARLDSVSRPRVRFRLRGRDYELPLVRRYRGHSKVLLLPVGYGRAVTRATPLPTGFNILGQIKYRPDPLTGLPSYYFPLEALEEREGS